MAEKIKLSISPAVAAFVRPGTSPEIKLTACITADGMATPDRVMLLFCLSKDADPAIRATAISRLSELPEEVIREYVNGASPHPLVLGALPPIGHNCTETPPTAEKPAREKNEQEPAMTDIPPDTEAGEEKPVNEESEEFLSKYKKAQVMGIGEKIKMALSGDKEWRSLLVKDSNKLVSGSVIKNPRITEGEILTLIKSGIQNDEIMRLICANKEWIKNYTMRKALIENSRTPIQNAMRYLGTMSEKDLSYLAKSKNVATVISTMAKRLLLNKKKCLSGRIGG